MQMTIQPSKSIDALMDGMKIKIAPMCGGKGSPVGYSPTGLFFISYNGGKPKDGALVGRGASTWIAGEPPTFELVGKLTRDYHGWRVSVLAR